MKVSVLAARYAISGVPLAQLRFAQALAGCGHKVNFIVGLVNDGYDLPSINGINVSVFNKRRVISMLIPLIRHFRKDNPDVIFSAGDHLNVIVLIAAILSSSKAKISCSSRVTPFDTYSNVFFTKRWVLKLLMRMVMRRADALTCVSKDMVDQYRLVFKSPPHVCVYNIIVDSRSRDKMNEEVDEKWLIDKSEPVIVAAGMLEPWKGFSDLILSMKELAKTIKAKLIILGNGSLRGELQSLINELGLMQTVKLAGYVDNPLKYFSRADVFVLSSYVEGMPNVLVEAMMCGCTPVSTDCPTGPRELLQDGKYGYLVPVKNPLALAEGIEKALDHPISKEILSEAVRPFTESEVIKRHFEILRIEGSCG
ncbi:MAG: glycosyltransferase [Nitrospirae bacterium]|nr:MAG: glycosyltransferase [Nitrospirota bacterium]